MTEPHAETPLLDDFTALLPAKITHPIRIYVACLAAYKQIASIYNGSLSSDASLHVPARLQNHLKSTLAYDIRTAGGTITDVVSAFVEAGLVTVNPDKYVDFKDVAQNAYRAGKTYINGDYFKILNRQ